MWNHPRIWTSWSGQSGSFIVAITSQLRDTKRTYMYVYKPDMQRWDKWSVHIDGDEITNIFLGADGETYFANTGGDGVHPSGLNRLLGQKDQYSIQEGQRKDWVWQSKRIDMNASTQKKKFKRLKIISNQDLVNSTTLPEVVLDSNVTILSSKVTPLSESATDEEKYYLNEYELDSASGISANFYGLKLRISATSDVKIESLGTVFRRKSVK